MIYDERVVECHNWSLLEVVQKAIVICANAVSLLAPNPEREANWRQNGRMSSVSRFPLFSNLIFCGCVSGKARHESIKPIAYHPKPLPQPNNPTACFVFSEYVWQGIKVSPNKAYLLNSFIWFIDKSIASGTLNLRPYSIKKGQINPIVSTYL